MAPAPPILHILAGPNGAGKTSLYEATIRRLIAAEFVTRIGWSWPRSAATHGPRRTPA